MMNTESSKPRATPPDPIRANHERIKYKLRMQGYSLTDVSRILEVSKPTLTLISLGQQRSRRVESGLASILGEKLSEAFPDRYRILDNDQETAKPDSLR
jgi:lambda repressor-like predicted transcriptional regulator